MTLLDQRDMEFFDAVSLLMDKQFPEMREKYGMWKIHNHFEITDNQVFHETTDHEKQISVLRIIDKNELPKNAYPTTWTLDKKLEHKPSQWCCDWTP